LALAIIFSPAFDGIFRFILMVFTAFIGVPAAWIILRGEKAGDQDHTYPNKATRPTPTEKFGEFTDILKLRELQEERRRKTVEKESKT